jgi:arsenite methyltransferase
MILRARENQTKSGEKTHVTFIEANITQIPLEDGIADCVISNCVLNLVPEPEKPRAFMEIGRLLKSGGRAAVSDILARKEMPAHIKDSVALYVGCIAGASSKDDYMRYLNEAGFKGSILIPPEITIFINHRYCNT